MALPLKLLGDMSHFPDTFTAKVTNAMLGRGNKSVHVTSLNKLLQTAVIRQIQQFRSAEEKASIHHLQSSCTYVFSLNSM